MQLEPDERWLNCEGCQTFESYCLRLGLPALRPDVDKDVAGRLERARGLAHHAYFHYEFLDIAAEYAFMTLELLLRRALSRPRRGLKSLVATAEGRGLITQRQARGLGTFRNALAHPSHDFFGGVAVIPPLVAVFELANQLAASEQPGCTATGVAN